MIVLLVPSLLVGTQARMAGDRILYRQGFLTVVSPDGATPEEAREAAKKVQAAWKFDLSVMHWANRGAMEKPFTFRLVSDARMQAEHPGSRARATADGNFQVRMGLLNEESFDLTLAHELGHIQAFRALGQNHRVPRYFMEGHGLMMNLLYGDHLGIDRHKGGEEEIKAIESVTADEARNILTDPNYFKVGTAKEKQKKEDTMEKVGVYFVEYLRVRKGIRDVVPKMGRVFELMGHGKTYYQAFRQTDGISVQEAVSDMVDFFRRTQSHPDDRFRGTRYAQYLVARAR